jgi:hypothetical protein
MKCTETACFSLGNFLIACGCVILALIWSLSSTHSEHILHEGATTRTELDEINFAGLTHGLPHGH